MECEGLQNGPELTVCQAARAAAEAAAAARKLAEGESWSDMVVAILGAIGALALPVMAIVVIILIWPLLRDLFQNRKFTLKIGGFELSAQEATDQIRKQIEELQAQIAQLKEPEQAQAGEMGDVDDFTSTTVAATSPPPILLPGAILWVDDIPSNNAFMIADFMDQGIKVDQALSTDDAMRLLASKGTGYGMIISDLGRTENGRYVADAGAQLARQVRDMGSTAPLIIYASARAVRERDRLMEVGAHEVTNNSTKLRSTVLRHFTGRVG